MSKWESAVSAPYRPPPPGTPASALSEADLERLYSRAYLYLRAYLMLRLAIGALGVLLPVVLLAGDGLFLKGSVWPRESLSAYYHSGMRDEFVGTLVATGVFLITYK